MRFDTDRNTRCAPIPDVTCRFNGWSVTLADSLDTIWLMGLKDEFYKALTLIRRQKFLKSVSTRSSYFPDGLEADLSFTVQASGSAPFFETIIRYLGGYLSAYALSGEPLLLSLADDLGGRMLPAFNTEIGWPVFSVRPSE